MYESDTEQMPRLDPTETAVILIQYQNDFVSEGGTFHEGVKDVMEAMNMLENTKHMVERARKSGCLIAHVPTAFTKGHPEVGYNTFGVCRAIKQKDRLVEGKWGTQICDSLRPHETDLVVHGKVGLCCFYSTNLDWILRSHGIKNLVLGGFVTNCSVESTARTAYERGFKVYTVEDCTACASIQEQNFSFSYNFAMFSIPVTSNAIISALKSHETTEKQDPATPLVEPAAAAVM